MPRRFERHARVALGHAANVGFVDHRLIPWRARGVVVLPGEGGVHDDRFGHRARRVARVKAQILLLVAHRVAVQVVAPAHRPADRLRVRVDEQLVRLNRCPRAGSYGPSTL